MRGHQYGRPDNSSRPGGPMRYTHIVSKSKDTTFRLIADSTTVVALISEIRINCKSSLTKYTPSTPAVYNDSFSSWPQPEQTIQYYRASTVALTLDSYNNTAALNSENGPDVPLPLSSIDTKLLDCLNTTIGSAVPLVNGATAWPAPNMSFFGLFWAIWCLFYVF
jgi:hypothetical protein